MTSNSINGKSLPTYLLVLDLLEAMGAYERVGLQIPDDVFLKEKQFSLVEKLHECVPGCAIETIESNKLVNQIASLLHSLLLKTPEAVVISTVSEVAMKTSGHCLQINRLVDSTGKLLGIGARPGNNSLRSQFCEIKSFLEKRPVILVEDGSFSGGTMKLMIEICNEMQINVKYLVIGIFFPAARENLSKVFPRINDVYYWKEGNFLDWMPDHDFYPFIPNAGKVVGFSYNNHYIPVCLHNGLSLCMPYIIPYGNPTEWASISREMVYKFSIFCIRETISIFEEMERLNKQKITLENLIGTYPHVSLPVCSDEREFPHIETRILDILYDDAQMLA